MKYYIAHNGNDIVHYAQVADDEIFISGQPIIEEYENETEWINRLKELGVEYEQLNN